MIVEFARRDHREALEKFSPGFLQNSVFLLVEASTQTAMQRIHRRADNEEHFIGDEIMTEYFGMDNSQLMKDYHVPGTEQIVECIWNEGLTKEEFQKKGTDFVEKKVIPFLEAKETQQMIPLGLPLSATKYL